jgi:hypothetical protein
MSRQILSLNWFTDLSTQQQELLVGGADFELSGSNFANRLVSLRGSTSSGPNGSFANSAGLSSTINTAVQDLLGLGVLTIPTFAALGSAPTLTDLLVPTANLGLSGL